MNKMMAARVKETTTTTGTGTYSLAGTVSGYRTFASAFVSGQMVYYTVVFGNDWEQGIGIFTAGAPSTLSRLTVMSSSNSDAAVNWGAGTKSIFCSVTPAAFYETQREIWLSRLNRAALGTFLTVASTAYAVYVGRTSRPYTAAFVEFHVTTIGAGAQTAEAGIFSSPLAPNKAGQTLTKLVATGTLDSLVTTGVKRNTTSFALAIAQGTHLWAVYRGNMASTEPTMSGLAGDMSQGHILTLAAAGALTGIATIAGAVPALATATIAPDLRIANS
jgi:hypothetical protein